MKEQEEVLKWEAENDLIWVDEFEFDLENIDKADIDDFATELFPEKDPDLPPHTSYEPKTDFPNFSFGE